MAALMKLQAANGNPASKCVSIVAADPPTDIPTRNPTSCCSKLGETSEKSTSIAYLLLTASCELAEPQPSVVWSTVDWRGVAATLGTASLYALAHPPMPIEVWARLGHRRHRSHSAGMLHRQVGVMVRGPIGDVKSTSPTTPAGVISCTILARCIRKTSGLGVARDQSRRLRTSKMPIVRAVSQKKDYHPAVGERLA